MGPQPPPPPVEAPHLTREDPRHAWERLKDAVEAAGLRWLQVPTGVRTELNRVVDLPPPVLDLLEVGWPMDLLRVGRAEVLPRLTDLAAEPPPGWPRDLLPLARVGSDVLAWEPTTGRIVRVVAGGTSTRTLAFSSLGPWVDEVVSWLAHVPAGEVFRIGRHVGLHGDAFELLSDRLGPGWTERWLFEGTQPLGELRATLETERRLNLRTARISGLIVLAAPAAGWLLGSLLTPPRPWEGLALAALVVGGVPSLLLAHATVRASRLSAELERLPGG